MEQKPIVELHAFLASTDEQLRHVDIYFLATKIICSAWLSIQILVNSKILKLSLNLSFTHLRAQIAFMS